MTLPNADSEALICAASLSRDLIMDSWRVHACYLCRAQCLKIYSKYVPRCVGTGLSLRSSQIDHVEAGMTFRGDAVFAFLHALQDGLKPMFFKVPPD